jgi:microcystin-dependent protein
MAINAMPGSPLLPSDTDRAAYNQFSAVITKVNEIIKDTNDLGTTPPAHKAEHATGGSDALSPADIGAEVAGSGVPVGAVMAFAMDSAPSGWLKCNGQAVSRITYAVLFTAIGTTFGVGDSSTTFNVPDLRGEFVRGWDDSRDVDSGRVFGSSQADEVKAHTHDGYVGNTSFAAASGASGTVVRNPTAIGDYGGSETRPRNIALLYCIKY